MINDLVAALWFFLPAGMANMAPVLVSNIGWLKFLDKPLDFGKKVRKKRIFGAHKTFRGFVSGFLLALVYLFFQRVLFENSAYTVEISYINYSDINLFLYAFLFSFGALGGDAIKSFFKRQMGVKSGESWLVFDQADYIIGGLLAVSLAVRLEPVEYLTIFCVWIILHPLSTVIGYWVGLKDKPL